MARSICAPSAYSPVVEGFDVEKNGIEINLVPLDAEFSAE